MSELGLGKIITNANQERDAIHVAVAPVEAAMELMSGQHVEVDGDKASLGKNPIGIVDPFLTQNVKKGERFWLFLYPNTVINLRHHWKHPSFDGLRSISEDWLRKYAIRVGPYYKSEDEAYSRFMKEAKDGTIYYYGNGCYCLSDVEDADELFRHLSIVLGRSVGGDDFSYRCAC